MLILEQAFEICHYDICKGFKTTYILPNKTSLCSFITNKLKCTSITLEIGAKAVNIVFLQTYYSIIIYSLKFALAPNFMICVLKIENWQIEMTTILNLVL